MPITLTRLTANKNKENIVYINKAHHWMLAPDGDGVFSVFSGDASTPIKGDINMPEFSDWIPLTIVDPHDGSEAPIRINPTWVQDLSEAHTVGVRPKEGAIPDAEAMAKLAKREGIAAALEAMGRAGKHGKLPSNARTSVDMGPGSIAVVQSMEDIVILLAGKVPKAHKA